MWGTFLHAAGPLLVGLTVAAMLGADAAIARVAATRGWGAPMPGSDRSWSLAVALPFGCCRLSSWRRHAAEAEAR